MQVLIVDDIEKAADSLAEVLDIHGHQVSVAYDGFTALATAAEVPPDAAIVDLGMPGMDGFELSKQLRREHGDTMRLIAYTGWNDETTRQRAVASGFDTVLEKPAPFDALIKALHGRSENKS